MSGGIVIILSGASYLSAINEVEVLRNNGNTVISVNFIPNGITPDYVFLSNTKRINQVKTTKLPIIKTSNVDFDFEKQMVIRYSDHINRLDRVRDNALLMLLSYLKTFDINQIFIAGLDGYNPYVEASVTSYPSTPRMNPDIHEKNVNISNYLRDLKRYIDISFLTPPINIQF